MLLVADDKVFIQSIDINYILDNYNEYDIPEELIKIKILDDNKFIRLNELETINFVLNDKNIIKFNDFIDMSDVEVHLFLENQIHSIDRYIYNNLYDSIPNPLDSSLKKSQEEMTLLDMLLLMADRNIYSFDYVINNINKYPIELRNTVYKYKNFIKLKEELFFKKENIDLTKDILKYRYSKKELRKIYNEIISDELSFEELCPIKEQLQVIFSRIDYTPEIQNIILSINRLSKNNDISFINDDLMESLLKIDGSKSKFEKNVFSLWEDIYVIGYKYLLNDSTKMLEVDIERTKKYLKYNITDITIKEIEKYNTELSNIMMLLSKYKFFEGNKINHEIITNICAYFYLKIESFNYDYELLYKIVNDIYNDSNINNNNLKEEITSNNIYMFSISIKLFEKLYEKYNNVSKTKKLLK